VTRVATVGAGAVVVGAAATAIAARRALGPVRATPAERTAILPGDELWDEAATTVTLAVDVAAPPDRVWPWVAQIGQDRGGFYSYAWLENLAGCRITNADRIVPEWQARAPGDVVLLHPQAGLVVVAVDPPSSLVLRAVDLATGGAVVLDRPPFFDFSWAFSLRPAPAGTRLVVRERYLAGRPAVVPALGLLALGSSVMSRRMLLGIRERAERGA